MPKRTRTKAARPRVNLAHARLTSHFGKQSLDSLVTASRTFPIAARVDVQSALDALFSGHLSADLVGIHSQFMHETVTIGHLLHNVHSPIVLGPLQHDEIDVGESMPSRCLRQGVWLGESKATKFALLLSPALRYGQPNGSHVEIAVPPGDAHDNLSRQILEEIEQRVRKTATYRGKVISLEQEPSYAGDAGAVRVHKLKTISRDQVILPEKTLGLLGRNISQFIACRQELRKLGMPVKKGLLFHGPPGTGKTHTIHYLASQLPEHTTLLITSEQVLLLDSYFQLARFLQPAMIVVEDVDLIARARENMRGGCEETLLNKLLNEMDGLREDAEILFVLTTNHPELLEAALASRPGRIDQAIEFPLPDDDGRRQLVRLYAAGLDLSEVLIQDMVAKTEKASAAFIKELMRRSAQIAIQAGTPGTLSAADVDTALEELLFAGGRLNVKILGGAAGASVH